MLNILNTLSRLVGILRKEVVKEHKIQKTFYLQLTQVLI